MKEHNTDHTLDYTILYIATLHDTTLNYTAKKEQNYTIQHFTEQHRLNYTSLYQAALRYTTQHNTTRHNDTLHTRHDTSCTKYS